MPYASSVLISFGPGDGHERVLEPINRSIELR
jgi:hypothetical protein